MTTAPFADRFERLLGLVMTDERMPFVRARRAEFLAATGEPFDEDRTLEARLQGFLEWLVFDVVLPEGDTAPRLLARRAPDVEAQDGWRAFGRTVHGLFLVRSSTPTALRAENVLTGANYTVRNAPATLTRGELFEGRLYPDSSGWRFTDAFLFHPAAIRRRLTRELCTGALGALSPTELLWTLARMASRAEHFRNVRLEKLYNFQRPPPKTEVPAMRFDAASVAARRARPIPVLLLENRDA